MMPYKEDPGRPEENRFDIQASKQHLSLDTLKNALSMMYLIRQFEEKAAQVYTLGKISGFCHLCIGEEAVAVGASLAMEEQDSMITAYRAHGHALARGLTPVQVMGELMGKGVGCSKGKGGSMHMFHKEKGFYGGHGIVGSQISLGTGIAFSHKYLEDGGVCLTLLGDGASNQGQFFESMNMAALWSLPVIYIIENNHYAMGTSVARACARPDALYRRGESFGIPGYRIKGDDIFEVYAACKTLINEVRHTSRPCLLEIDTYRFKGHSMSDPGKYRTRTELDEARHLRDPIEHLSLFLREERGVSKEEIEVLRQGAIHQIEETMRLCEEAEEPTMNELFKDMYHEES